MTRDRQRARIRALLGALATIVGVAALLRLGYALRGIALLMVLSILFAYFLAPLVARCEFAVRWRGAARRVPRNAAIAIVYLGGVSLFALALSLLVPRIAHQLGALDQEIPLYFGARHDWGDTFMARLDAWQLPPALRNALNQAVSQGAESLHKNAREGLIALAGLLTFLPWLVLIPVIAAFLLADAPAFRSSMLTLLPEGRVRWRGREFFEDVNQTIAHVVRAQLLSCLIIGVICTAGFFILGVPFALLLGVGAGLLEMIPMAGPLITLAAAALLAGVHSPQLAISTAIFLIALRAVQDNVIYPRLIASGVKLHPLVVILALLCGVELAGVIGLFLAIPLTAFLSVSYRHIRRQWSGGVLADLFEAREPEPLSVPPVRAPQAGSVPPAPGRRTPVEHLNLLVVDDDDNARALLAALLRAQGARVSTAGSSAQALALLGKQRFDAMLSDIGMPGGDGFELIRKVRALGAAEGGNMPAAALTGYGTAEDRERATAAGFQRHLGKPIDANELFSTVAALVQESAAQGPR